MTPTTATLDCISTPSPPTYIKTPDTPRLGFCDPWEPYSPPRKSARISSRRQEHRTPSPPPPPRTTNPSHHRVTKHTATPRSCMKSASSTSPIAMPSPNASPQKKRGATAEVSRKASGLLTAEGAANAATALGLDRHGPDKIRATSSVVTRTMGMLPTPAKTPQQKADTKNIASIQAIARSLFHSDEAPPSPKRNAKKYSGISMESFAVEQDDAPIEIYTDARERFPEKDTSSDNPFYGNSVARPDSKKRRSKRKVVVSDEGPQDLEDAIHRDDGIVYVFRGKRIFRKFAPQNDDDDDDDDQGQAIGSQKSSGRVLRSQIKPRLLFPPPKKSQAVLEQEEAVTDVEDVEEADTEPEQPTTPRKTHKQVPSTPDAPLFGPVSPPDTKRITRSTFKSSESTPTKSAFNSQRSPFDNWPRLKDHRLEAGTRKRTGENSPAGHIPAKKARL